ncbi:hypothetical protein V5O48_011293 [Marasmius crinis-equi]|uniref:F-box domain-containing protein n=1 Tax=Marasmius crinis-equi TaxID=585013 RepID=A0ABR3F620_9AGAR
MFTQYEYPDITLWDFSGHTQRHLLSLPTEILDQILSELDLRSDLISLALANRACSHLVIPRHSEYRVIRTRHRLAAMWAHLARRSDLARNVRKVHCCSKDNQTAPDQHPITLVPSGRLGPQEELYQERARIANICQALRHMRHLQEFIWESPEDPHHMLSILSAWNEGNILEALQRSKKLTHLSLSGYLNLRPSDPSRQIEQIWNMGHLQYVSLRGDVWGLPHMGALIREFPVRSPLLKSGAGISSTKAWSSFVSNHPALEEFSCLPLLVNLPTDGLPSLKCLQTDLNSLGDFATTRETPSIECIDATLPLTSLGEKFLKSPNCSNLRRLALRTWPTATFLSFAEAFPKLTWLSVRECPVMDVDDLLCYLSRFRQLEVFRGNAIWRSVDDSDEKMHEAILKLVQFCPNLRELDHRTHHVKRRAQKRIVIIREERDDGSLGITYEVRRPSPRSYFDTAGGIFD